MIATTIAGRNRVRDGAADWPCVNVVILRLLTVTPDGISCFNRAWQVSWLAGRNSSPAFPTAPNFGIGKWHEGRKLAAYSRGGGFRFGQLPSLNSLLGKVHHCTRRNTKPVQLGNFAAIAQE